MSEGTNLRVDWCSYEAAKYAVEHWHYSGSVPAGKNVYMGVWENYKYIGAVIFGTGVAPYSGQQFGLRQQEICELVRVALSKHVASVTKILSIAIKMLKRQSPKLRLVVSYADPEQSHIGGIYQAGNWLYVGTIKAEWFEDKWHNRINTKTLRTGRRGLATKLKIAGTITSVYLTKYKYLYALDTAMRKQIELLSKPYPKRETCGTGETDNAAGSNQQTGGASPTVPL